MNKQQLTYINPRLAILSFPGNFTQKNSLIQLQITLKSRHKQYFHFFNLSSSNFIQKIGLLGSGSTNFKWRGIPYSLTQAIKILASIQNYQSKNQANSAILVTNDKACLGFCEFVCQIYYETMNKKLGLCKNDRIIQQYNKIYKNIQIKNPPVKILQSLTFKYPQHTFIPIVKIFSQSRHNNFEQIYFHNSADLQLSKYYIQKKSPLNSGQIGVKYCQKKPEMTYFTKPVVVCGDVKIEVYSFTTLQLQKQFVIGFNTKALQFEQSVIRFTTKDMYELLAPEQLGSSQHYCQKCIEEAGCADCFEIGKKFGNTYVSAQLDLEKIHKNRQPNYVEKILGN